MSDFQQYMKGQGGSHGDYQSLGPSTGEVFLCFFMLLFFDFGLLGSPIQFLQHPRIILHMLEFGEVRKYMSQYASDFNKYMQGTSCIWECAAVGSG